MRWLAFLRRSYWDRERAGEIESYLEIETAENMANGMTPEQARAAARRKFGNSTLVREEMYRMNTISWLESVWQDLRYGVRMLTTNPGFAAVGILSLALGIGANTAIFQLVNAVRLRSLPVEKPQELAEVRIAGGNGGLGMSDGYAQLTRPMWEELQRNHPAFLSMFAWNAGDGFVGKGNDPEVANFLFVTGDAFRTLGVSAWRGRLIGAEDEHACPETVANVSYAYWQGKLGGKAIDSYTKLLVDGLPLQIIGVTPPSFFGLVVGDSFDIVRPLCHPKELSRNWFNIAVLGRLRPRWTLQKASAQLAAVSPGIMAATEITGYDASSTQRYRRFKLEADEGSAGVSYLRREYDSSLQMLLGITGLVLLIACANLASLMLARASAREREIGVRLALGAARGRLLRQLLVESALLAMAGALLGIGLAEWLSRALIVSLGTEMSSVKLDTPLDWRVLLFTAGVTMLTCLLFGVVPALRASGIDPVGAMKAGGRGMTASRERFSFQRGMVVAQIAISMVLLVGAFLFVRSLHNLMTFDPGMREAGVTHAFFGLQKVEIPSEHLEEFKRELLAEVEAVPGVRSAALTSFVPLSGGSWGHQITIGKTEGPARFSWVSPDFFQTMGIPVLRGRALAASDTATAQRVAVVNETFVRSFFKGRSALGETIRTHPEPNYPETLYQIVGVIADTKYNDLRSATPPMVFAPYSQFPDQRRWAQMMIYSTLAPAVVAESVKKQINQTHPDVIARFRGFQGQIRDGMVRERLMATLSGFFGLLAAVLGMVGLYGVMSYIVGLRQNEIGIRLALGANRGQVIGMVMKEVIFLLALGLVIGAACALMAGHWANALLFGLKAYDAMTLGCAAVLLTVVGGVAGLLPALRGSKVDAAKALRCD